jgi:Tfp pilus assembly protein PilV
VAYTLRMPTSLPTRRASRRGLSYLEVLMAAAIGMAGLLGAIAMFPVAILNMQRGVVADTMSYIGPSALEQAQSVGATRRANWIAYDTTTQSWSRNAANDLDTLPLPTGDPRSVPQGPWNSVCIDPRFCAEIDVAAIAAGTAQPGQFPHVPANGANNEARMLRVTLRGNTGGPMSVNQARLLVKTADDLIFDKPEDAGGPLPARQAPLLGSGGAAVRRDYMGNFEWMITLTPKLSGVPTNQLNQFFDGSTGAYNTSIPETMPFVRTNQYLASVVVFYQRPARLESVLAGLPSDPDPDPERVVNVAAFPGQGYNGGDVLIQTRASTTPARPELDLQVHIGDWVMLSGVQYSLGTPRKYLGPRFQWYRVTAVEANTELVGGLYQRYVTLEGADWPIVAYPSNHAQQDQVNPTDSLIPGVTQMTIVSGVAGVYEHTVTVE